MMFWILAAMMTAAVAVFLLVPLARRTRRAEPEQAFDVEVYRDQLQEIDRDVENNLISAGEADFARAEVSRRLIKVSKQAERAARSSRSAAWVGRIAVIVLLPAFAIAGYLWIGNPGAPSQSVASRQNTPPETQGEQPARNGQDINALLSEAEIHLERNPEDGKGWDVIAPIYMRLGRLPAAVMAYRNAIRILGSTPKRQAELGQVLFVQADGIVTEQASKAFQAVLEFEPQNPYASYFLALELAQNDRKDEAIQAFTIIANNSPPDAPWMPPVRQQLQKLSGPDAGDVEAAMEMTAEERREMIQGMVAGLDAKLQENPGDLQGWLRLIQSYMVLGQANDAERAFGQALENFQDGSTQQSALNALAVELGLEKRN